MKFSIVIPTKNRPGLLEVVVRHAMQIKHVNFEVIVSDNSATHEQRKLNSAALHKYIGLPNLRIVYPPRNLAAPEHFEFALNLASGDYVTFLTDKMIILPDILSKVQDIIAKHDAEIVNWAYAPFTLVDPDVCDGAGTLVEDKRFLNNYYEFFDPIEALKFKAGCSVPRNQQTTRDYALGKIIFGVYSKELINRIHTQYGKLFGGATHDYSAMIQALSMAKTCVIINSYGIIFISLPANKSLGSLTASDSKWALKYFEEFTDTESIMSNLFVPELYASQHNMVAYDYKKYLRMYGHSKMFNAENWNKAILNDLSLENRIWQSKDEKKQQFNIFFKHLEKYESFNKPKIIWAKVFLKRVVSKLSNMTLKLQFLYVTKKMLPIKQTPYRTRALKSLEQCVVRFSGRKTERLLIIYSASQTYTSTVFEHLDAFREYSKFDCEYIDFDELNKWDTDLSEFTIVVVHYSVRLPFNNLKKSAINNLKKFRQLKVLFIQDEYDYTNLSKQFIREIGFDIVYTVVPQTSITEIYPKHEFPSTKFINCLTGYVPKEFAGDKATPLKTSERKLTVAYRGRELPIYYGKLGQEKMEIGQVVKKYCQKNGISCDIGWEESSRIYGDSWYSFISSAKAMLGTESGSNVFDFDGSLRKKISEYCKNNPRAKKSDIYQNIVAPLETEGIMNQLSPKIFEMVAARTVMILFEGNYSGVLKPNIHYLCLKKNFSNLEEIFESLSNDQLVDKIVERAFNDIIATDRYSYRNFIKSVDHEFEVSLGKVKSKQKSNYIASINHNVYTTSSPFQAKPPPHTRFKNAKFLGTVLIAIWQIVPIAIRPYLKKIMGRIY